MAIGTVTKITENGSHILVEATIGGAIYRATVSKVLFDAQPTPLDKQNLIISLLSSARRSGKTYEDTFATLVGAVITVPD